MEVSYRLTLDHFDTLACVPAVLNIKLEFFISKKQKGNYEKLAEKVLKLDNGAVENNRAILACTEKKNLLLKVAGLTRQYVSNSVACLAVVVRWPLAT